VIPILTPMIRGEKITLTPEKQTILARWIAMKVMVGEHNHPKDAVTSYAERNQFKETMQIPANMNIWLGWCGQGGWATAYFRETHTVSRTLTPAPEEIASKNMQEIAFGIGQLFIHIFHTTVAETGIEFNINPEAILRLWPLNGGDFVWPPEIRMNVMEANNVRTLIQQILGSPNVLWLSAPVPRPLIFGS
jgi:hypothetical protein